MVTRRLEKQMSTTLVEKDLRIDRLRNAIPLLLTVLTGSICYGLFFNRGLGLSVIGYSIAPAERVLQGEVPYRDFLFNYTPGILWINALLMKAFGPTLMTTRIGLFAFKLSALIVLFFVGERLTNRWVALIPVGLTLAWLGYGQVFNVYPDQYLIPFALIGLICLLRYDQTGLYSSLVWCGLATGVVFLFKYNVGILLLCAGTLSVIIREFVLTRRIKASLRAASFFIGSFAAVCFVFVIYLTMTSSLGAMVSHFFHHAAEYSETRSVSLPPPVTVIPAAMILIPVLALGFLVLFISRRGIALYFLALLVIGFPMLLRAQRGDVENDAFLASVAYLPPLLFFSTLILTIWQVMRNRKELDSWWERNGSLVITGLFALAVYLEVFPRTDYYHLVRVLPPVFLFLVVLLYRTLPKLFEKLDGFNLTSAMAAWLLFSIPVAFLIAIGVNNTWAPEFESGTHFRDNRELKIERGQRILVEEKQAELTEGLVQLIQANSSPDDYIFSFAQRGSALYFLANRKNPTRFLWWRSVGISDDERDAVMAMISNRRAKLIIVQDVAANKEIQDFISNNYEHIGTVGDIAIYGLKKEQVPIANTGIRVEPRAQEKAVLTALAGGFLAQVQPLTS
jgi:4-amino-4-deoxy-L-arabinose transferase-like glycosyltransferase